VVLGSDLYVAGNVTTAGGINAKYIPLGQSAAMLGLVRWGTADTLRHERDSLHIPVVLAFLCHSASSSVETPSTGVRETVVLSAACPAPPGFGPRIAVGAVEARVKRADFTELSRALQ
jgi:hypothetical protein